MTYPVIESATKVAIELTTEAFRMELMDCNIQMTYVAAGDCANNIAAGIFHATVLESSPYKKANQNTLDIMKKHVDEGKDPELMAKMIYKIINTPKPRGHYKVGEPLQKFSIALKRILPDKLYEKILLKHYKL